MRSSTLIALFAAMLSFVPSAVDGSCCTVNSQGICDDGTEGTPCCGVGKCNLFCCACHDGCRQGNNPPPTPCEACIQNCNDEIDTCIADQICTEYACSPTNAECQAIFTNCANACNSEYPGCTTSEKKVKRATTGTGNTTAAALGVCNLPGADPATRQLIIASLLPQISNATCGPTTTDPDCTDGQFIRLDTNGDMKLSATEYANYAMAAIARKHYSEFQAYMEYFLTYLSNILRTNDSFDTDGDAMVSYQEYQDY